MFSKLTFSDAACIVAAVAAVFLWYTRDQPNTSVGTVSIGHGGSGGASCVTVKVENGKDVAGDGGDATICGGSGNLIGGSAGLSSTSPGLVIVKRC
jgi:hypothetical protein